MGLPDLYPAQVGSPYTTLAAPYTSGEGTMTLVDATKLPTAPNIVCLAGDVAGEFSYTGKEGNVLQGVTALPGTPVATTWPVGTYAFRGIAAYDLNSLIERTDGITRTATYVVAASDAPAHVKRQADYVCDGTDDQVEIQAAIDALSGIGGTVRLVTGTYVLGVTGAFYIDNSKYSLMMDVDDVALIGEPGAVLKLADGIDIGGTAVNNDFLAMMVLGDADNLRISGITFDANQAAVTAGQVIALFHWNAGANVEIDHNRFQNHRNWALWGDDESGSATGGPEWWQIHHNTSYGPQNGFAIHNARRYIDIHDNIVGYGSYCSTGIFVDTVSHVMITNNIVIRPSGSGIAAYDEVSYLQITGNQILGKSGAGTARGIYLSTKGTLDTAIEHAIVSGNIMTTVFGALDHGVWVADEFVRYTNIIDNVFDGPVAPVTDSGTGTVVRGNRGYITENSGAAASTTDGGTIAHGCAATPTIATVSGSVAGEIVTVTSIDATNITVAIKKPDGSAGTSQTIYWRAEV